MHIVLFNPTNQHVSRTNMVIKGGNGGRLSDLYQPEYWILKIFPEIWILKDPNTIYVHAYTNTHVSLSLSLRARVFTHAHTHARDACVYTHARDTRETRAHTHARVHTHVPNEVKCS